MEACTKSTDHDSGNEGTKYGAGDDIMGMVLVVGDTGDTTFDGQQQQRAGHQKLNGGAWIEYGDAHHVQLREEAHTNNI